MKASSFKVLALAFFALTSFSYASYDDSLWVGPSTTIKFENGQSTLTKDAEKELDRFVKGARNDGTVDAVKIDQIQLAAWSDTYPTTDRTSLPSSDRILANERATAIRKYLKKELYVPEVVIHNVAEDSSWLNNAFVNDERLISVITRGDLDTIMTKKGYGVLKGQGETSSVVVLAILKNKF